jgi:hypothetical protein
MRTGNQHDLVDKRSQAGVTIVFSDSGRKKTPSRLENCRQMDVHELRREMWATRLVLARRHIRDSVSELAYSLVSRQLTMVEIF